MKRRNAFTLIELLAIIVILAIIAVITVPIILNIIENSRKGAATDSAYGYKDAINKYYLKKLYDNPNWNEFDATYNVNSDGNLVKSPTETYDITVSGQHPTDGYIVIQNKQTSGCLIYGDYAVTIKNGEVTNTKKGDCKFATQDDAITAGEITTGDLVCINDTEECFYVISNENGITTMLSRYNLNVGANPKGEETGIQDSDVKGYVSSGTMYGNVKFSDTDYWSSPNTVYPIDIYDEVNYSSAPNSGDNKYSVAYYVKNYKNYLLEKNAIINSARLLTINEAVSTNIGCNSPIPLSPSSTSTCTNVTQEKKFIYSTSYFLGSSAANSSVYFINSTGQLYVNGYNGAYYGYGVRPVIEIPTSSINLKS